MANKRLTQSPQAIRGSAQDWEKYSRDEARLDLKSPRKDGSAENRNAWEHLEQDRDGSGWPPKTNSS